MAIKYIDSVKYKIAEHQIREIYNELKNDMGDVVEPISLHAVNVDLLKAVWHVLREVVIIEGKATRVQKEAVGAAISEGNRCGYCVDAHTIMLIGLKDNNTAQAIVDRDPSSIADTYLHGLVKWALEGRKFDAVIVKCPPFTMDVAPEIIGTAVFFHYLNRMVTAFLGPTILPMNISFFKGIMKIMAGKMFSGVLAKNRTAMELEYTVMEIPSKLAWANSNPQVAQVFAEFDRLLTEMAVKYVPIEVSDMIREHIRQWDGQDLMLTQDVSPWLSTLPPGYKEIGRTLLLQAFAPDRINSQHIEALKSFYNDNDEALLIAMAWVSFEAATYIGTRLGEKFVG